MTFYFHSAPRERPKLHLAKRSEAHAEEEAAAAAAAAAAKSAIFGGAKPVDTTKREKEIEEKLKKPHPAEHRYSRRHFIGITLGLDQDYLG
jgi:hypothetical protein